MKIVIGISDVSVFDPILSRNSGSIPTARERMELERTIERLLELMPSEVHLRTLLNQSKEKANDPNYWHDLGVFAKEAYVSLLYGETLSRLSFIEEAKEDFKHGRVYSLKQARKELGI